VWCGLHYLSWHQIANNRRCVRVVLPQPRLGASIQFRDPIRSSTHKKLISLVAAPYLFPLPCIRHRQPDFKIGTERVGQLVNHEELVRRTEHSLLGVTKRASYSSQAHLVLILREDFPINMAGFDDFGRCRRLSAVIRPRVWRQRSATEHPDRRTRNSPKVDAAFEVRRIK